MLHSIISTSTPPSPNPATRPQKDTPARARAAPRRRTSTRGRLLLPRIQGGAEAVQDLAGGAARQGRARDVVGAALLGRRAAAERGRRRSRRRRRRGGDVRVAVQPGAARAGVRGDVRRARVGVPRLPLRLPHPVRRPPARSLPSILCPRREGVVRFDAVV